MTPFQFVIQCACAMTTFVYRSSTVDAHPAIFYYSSDGPLNGRLGFFFFFLDRDPLHLAAITSAPISILAPAERRF